MTADQLAHPTATAVCALLATEPRNQASLDAIVEAVRQAAARHGEISRNDVAPLVPPWVAPHLIGTAFAGLVSRKALVWTGRWTTSEDRKGRNVGKPAKVYRWDGGSTNEL